MSSARLTLLGLYKADDTIFDLMVLPEGIDKDMLINNILLKSSDFEILYPDPNFIKPAIELWSNKWERTFRKWYEALNINYAPLENYDRYEDWTENTDHDHTITNVMNGKLSGNESNSGNRTGSKSAFDSSSLQPYDKDDTSSSTNTSSTADENTTNKLDESTNYTKTGRAHGNIGVTTSQQMLEAELEIDKWNLIEHITDIFLNEFCIMVY